MTPETTPWSFAAEIAERYIGEREVSRNQSPFIRRIWRATFGVSYFDDREPWCAAFVAYCVEEAARVHWGMLTSPCALSPSVAELVRNLTRAHVPRVPMPRRGDVVTFLPHFSHCGIVAGVLRGAVHTIEGNTNGDGVRDGDGVYTKIRPASVCTFWALPVRARVIQEGLL